MGFPTQRRKIKTDAYIKPHKSRIFPTHSCHLIDKNTALIFGHRSINVDRILGDLPFSLCVCVGGCMCKQSCSLRKRIMDHPIAIAIAIDPSFFITRRRRRFDDDDDDDLNRTGGIHTLSSSSHTYTNRRLFIFDTHKQTTLRSTST